MTTDMSSGIRRRIDYEGGPLDGRLNFRSHHIITLHQTQRLTQRTKKVLEAMLGENCTTEQSGIVEAIRALARTWMR